MLNRVSNPFEDSPRRGRQSRHAGKLFASSTSPSSSTILPQFDRFGHDIDREAPDEVLLALEEKLGREEAHELQELFKLVDKDGGGSISHDEFMELLHTLSVRPTPHEMELMYDELDTDKDGVVEYTEFLKFMCEPGLQSADGSCLLHAFQYLEGYAYDIGHHHPSSNGRSGRGGIIAIADLASAFKTYLPDKIRTDREANEILKNIPNIRGMLDYKKYVTTNVRPETLPKVDDNGNYIFEIRKLKTNGTSLVSATAALQLTMEAPVATDPAPADGATPVSGGSDSASPDTGVDSSESTTGSQVDDAIATDLATGLTIDGQPATDAPVDGSVEPSGAADGVEESSTAATSVKKKKTTKKTSSKAGTRTSTPATGSRATTANGTKKNNTKTKQ